VLDDENFSPAVKLMLVITTPAATAITTAAIVPIQNDFHFSPVISILLAAYSAG